MGKYAVTITAKVTKTLNVEADSPDRAVEIAHECFSAAPEGGVPERYDEQCDDVTPLDPSTPCEYGDC